LHDLWKDFAGYVCLYVSLSASASHHAAVHDEWSFWVFVYRVRTLSPGKPI